MRPLGVGSLAAHRLQEVALGVHDLHALVAPVGDVDVAGVVNGDGGGAVELAVGAAGFAKGGYELALCGELLDAVVAPVGDVDAAGAVYGNAPGQVELASAIALRAE